jgi:hypothetical protein
MKRDAEFPPDLVSKISEVVYRERLGPGGAESMIKKDGDDGSKLRGRSSSYDSLTRSYLRAIKQPTD